MCSTAGSLFLIWLVSFYSFILKINQKYMPTFFGTLTGPQYTVHLFRIGDDRMKMDVFGTNVVYWDSIRDEVMAFTHANWARWQAEKPYWFTEQKIATIPDEFIPRVDKDRKRSSVFRNLLGLGDEGEKNSKGKSAKKTSKVAAAEQHGTDGPAA